MVGRGSISLDCLLGRGLDNLDRVTYNRIEQPSTDPIENPNINRQREPKAQCDILQRRCIRRLTERIVRIRRILRRRFGSCIRDLCPDECEEQKHECTAQLGHEGNGFISVEVGDAELGEVGAAFVCLAVGEVWSSVVVVVFAREELGGCCGLRLGLRSGFGGVSIVEGEDRAVLTGHFDRIGKGSSGEEETLQGSDRVITSSDSDDNDDDEVYRKYMNEVMFTLFDNETPPQPLLPPAIA